MKSMSGIATANDMHASPLVSMRGITKRFGAVVANDQVDLDIFAGEVLALLGENGARQKHGDAPALRALSAGQRVNIRIAGENISFASPRDAMAAGIGMVFQQFSLLANLSVLENLLVAWPKAPWWQGRNRPLMSEVLVWLAKLAPHLDPNRRVSDLAVGERQIVELAKVLNLNPRVVILDEPTSVLTPDETVRLHGFVRDLAADGKAVIFITHKIADVKACADRVAVMRHGKLVEQGISSDKSSDEIIRAMVGENGRSRRRTGPARAAHASTPAIQAFHLGGRLPLPDRSIDADRRAGGSRRRRRRRRQRTDRARRSHRRADTDRFG